MASQTSIAVVAEKPSVARDIARVLKATNQGRGYLHGSGYVVTWAIGHLVALAQPHEIRPEWRAWRWQLLPMLPETWPLVVSEETREQFQVVQKILASPRITEVICATDAGREGELIFRYIYEAAGCGKPVRRLWISSLTPEAIQKGFAKLRAGSEYDHLADAARGRSRADWLVGMNLSRAYSLSGGDTVSVGRVQTPTLAMVVERELAIRNFVVEDYLNIVAVFSPDGARKYEGTWFRQGDAPLDAAARLAPDGEEAGLIVERVRGGQAHIEKIEAQIRRMPPPLLYDLTELQRHANRLFGFSAQQTLDAAQGLYERHKLISYPRTDSRHLSQDIAATLPKIVSGIAESYRGQLAPGTGQRPLGRRFVDDAKVTDHHAIIPTGVSSRDASLSAVERKIFDLICRRLLSAWHDDYIWSVTTVTTVVLSGAEQTADRFHSSGTAVQQTGWKVLDIGGGQKKDKTKEKKKPNEGEDSASDDAGEDGQLLPPGLEEGQPQEVLEVTSVEKKTRPPKRLTEGTLLTAMETAGKTLDDKELSDAMKESGLGTPATRAAIIELLLKREFIVRRGKSLEATSKGIRLIGVVHPEVKSAAMTGQWEAFLRRIERGQAELGPFLEGIEQYVREVVGKVGSQATEARAAAAEASASNRAATEVRDSGREGAVPRQTSGEPSRSPSRGLASVEALSDPLQQILQGRFGFESFRPNQEAVCRGVIAGEDVLLVMPTGSGKSLCYQLPGIALGGTTLVISPLIALMEDQVAKLAEWGFAAERIHSNRDRAASREVCVAYLDGRLDFLFVAPERLRVPGFPEMLSKRKPCLVAIDEAHCISQWGHDFRPDYRNIGQHLPALRPAPVIALTATATPLVQDDIARQLGLQAPRHFIHGFRRDNIGIEVVSVPPSARTQLVCDTLRHPERRPAIVYTLSRREAESLARELARSFPAAAYHAGMDGRRREKVQTAFLNDRVEVIVATVAFGMGIDKAGIRTVIHAALPASVEGYYQEIGRAGRDALPSRAILMYSYADRYTHDFFHERDYPDPAELARIFESLRGEPQTKEAIRAQSRLTDEAFDTALEKLWIHGGAVVDYAENVNRGSEDWRNLYVAQREHKMAQFERMLAYCETAHCRMQALVGYFGDTEDSGVLCGSCDFCAPAQSVAQRFREATETERGHASRILETLKRIGSVATGRLHAQVFADGSLERRGFEKILLALARCNLVELAEASFEKDGKRIDFRKVRITAAGRNGSDSLSLLIPMEIEAQPGAARKKRAKTKRAPAEVSASRDHGVSTDAELEIRASGPSRKVRPVAASSERNPLLEAALKAWRLAEAKKKRMPAFRIFSDRVLHAIAADPPRALEELLQVPGIGPSIYEKYGAQIFNIVKQAGS